MAFRTWARAAAGAALFATAAAAGDLDITNHTVRVVHHLYLSPVGRNDWGVDQLASGNPNAIAAGGKFQLIGIADGTYDIKLVMGSGKACVARKVVFEGETEWAIDDNVVAEC